MSMTLQIIGALAILAFFLAVCLCAFWGIQEVMERRSLRIRAYASEQAHRHLGQYIVACAYWFDDRKAREAVIAIGQNMSDWGHIDCNKVREAWRKACTESQAPEADGRGA